jgi:hypothetical protein
LSYTGDVLYRSGNNRVAGLAKISNNPHRLSGNCRDLAIYGGGSK